MQTPPPEGDRVSHEICKNISPPPLLVSQILLKIVSFIGRESVACIDATWKGGGETIIRGEEGNLNTIWGEGDDGNDGEAKMHLVIRRLPYGHAVK